MYVAVPKSYNIPHKRTGVGSSSVVEAFLVSRACDIPCTFLILIHVVSGNVFFLLPEILEPTYRVSDTRLVV